MNFLRRFFRKHRASNVRYATIDYGEYFTKPVVNGITLECRFMGNLRLTSGFLVACDPLLALHDAPPFSRRMRAGEYPVYLLITGGRAHRRNAVAMITFSDKTASQWELAQTPGRRRDSGFTIESGVGCLCDVHAQKHFNRYLERFFREHPDGDIYQALAAGGFSTTNLEDDDGNSFNFSIPRRPNLNVVLFNTGYGEGIYRAWWGITRDGEVCSLVLDFMVL